MFKKAEFQFYIKVYNKQIKYGIVEGIVSLEVVFVNLTMEEKSKQFIKIYNLANNYNF